MEVKLHNCMYILFVVVYIWQMQVLHCILVELDLLRIDKYPFSCLFSHFSIGFFYLAYRCLEKNPWNMNMNILQIEDKNIFITHYVANTAFILPLLSSPYVDVVIILDQLQMLQMFYVSNYLHAEYIDQILDQQFFLF